MQHAEQLKRTTQQEQLPPSSIPQKLKFIVLGAAGAGKTSLLRRYFYKQFEYERIPTSGADFYVGRVPISTETYKAISASTGTPAAKSQYFPHTRGTPNNDEKSNMRGMDTATYIGLQMWDTPGKENFALQQRRQQQHVKYTTSLSDSFVQHADAIMLVYDMTSSTSFTRLLKWYGDLIELFTKTKKTIPILIVANKLDLYSQGMECKGRIDSQQGRPLVAQRNVMGLHGIEYYGKNFQYEYQIVPATDKDAASAASISSCNEVCTTNDSSLGDPKYSRKGTKRRMEISTYLVNRDNWTTDGSYLESLLQSEDGSHPDRDMVLLWCMRNRLQLVEISAATGEGVHEAIEALIVLALGNTTSASNNVLTPDRLSNQMENRINDELDLHRRYANKNDNCCFIIPTFRRCCSQ
jgi:small GTP-binding protein